jgi:hypothetical protein
VALGVKLLVEFFAERNKNEHRERMLMVDVSNIFFIAAYLVKSGGCPPKIKKNGSKKKRI